MDKKHFKILEFLNNQTKPIKFSDFPDKIQSDFNPYGLGSDSLYHTLKISLSNKLWVKESKSKTNCFEITPLGKDELKEEIQRLESESKRQGTSLFINQVGDNYTTHGQNSPLSGKNSTQQNAVSKKEAWYKKIVDEFIKNLVQYMVTAGIAFISGLAIGKSCNLPNSLKKDQSPLQKNVRDTSRK